MFTTRELADGTSVSTDSSLGIASFSVCVAVPTGSRDEGAGQAGLAHLLEHVVMSGDPSGTMPVSDWATAVGGQANASTSKEAVAYWVRVPPAAAGSALERLLDAVTAPDLSARVVSMERQVIGAELRAAASDPLDRAVEEFYAALCPGHPLGRPVGGVLGDLRSSLDEVVRFHREGMAAHPLQVAMVGPDDVLRDVLAGTGRLDEMLARRPDGCPTGPGRDGTLPRPADPDTAVPGGADYAVLAAGGHGASRRDPLWAAFEILTVLVGGMPGSLLYNRLRQAGLSYELYSVATPLSDCGVWRVTAGCDPAEVGAVEETVRSCLADVADGRVEDRTVEMGRTQALGATLIDSEDPVVRAHVNAYWGIDGLARQPPVRCALRRLGDVRADEVSAAARRVLDSYTCRVVA